MGDRDDCRRTHGSPLATAGQHEVQDRLSGSRPAGLGLGDQTSPLVPRRVPDGHRLGGAGQAVEVAVGIDHPGGTRRVRHDAGRVEAPVAAGEAEVVCGDYRLVLVEDTSTKDGDHVCHLIRPHRLPPNCDGRATPRRDVAVPRGSTSVVRPWMLILKRTQRGAP